MNEVVRKNAKSKKRRSGKKPQMKPIVCSTGEVANTYDKYLKTEHWRALRRVIAEKYNYTCQLCKEVFKSNFNVHHLTYERIGNELTTDLIFYCEVCHNSVHGSKKIAPIIPRKEREAELRKIISRLDNHQIEELIKYATNKYPQIRIKSKKSPVSKVRSKEKVVERTAIQIMNNVKLHV